jgi:hypothetical protein
MGQGQTQLNDFAFDLPGRASESGVLSTLEVQPEAACQGVSEPVECRWLQLRLGLSPQTKYFST